MRAAKGEGYQNPGLAGVRQGVIIISSGRKGKHEGAFGGTHPLKLLEEKGMCHKRKVGNSSKPAIVRRGRWTPA